MRRSSVRRAPGDRCGWRRCISSKIATARRPGAAFNIGITSASKKSTRGSGRRPVILFEAIGRGETDRCLRGRDRRAVCLSERHVEPHLVIGDMAAGQWVDPSTRRSIHGAGRSRSHDDRGPRESFVASRCGAGTSGRASPSPRHQPRNDFLILIVAPSHLDCRAAASLPSCGKC